MSEQNGGQEKGNTQRLDRMENVIQSLLTLIEQERTRDRARVELERDLISQKFELVAKQHELAMDELREMRDLQREMRMDTMALFEGNKTLREAMQKYFERHP